MKKIELDIVALSHSVASSSNYAVVLGERVGARRLPIIIDGSVAQAIAVAMERMNPARPLTHDLMKNLLSKFEIDLKEVVINNLLDGIFYARLVCIKEGELIEIDSRTSDALALAVRFDCPIYTYEFILDAAGVVLEETDETKRTRRSSSKKSKAKGFADLSIEELNKKLNELLEKEDYENAAKIRDELNKRESN